MTTGYRRDIDGLRAVAVAAVVVYHLKASLVPGGYVGVDVFFVISGYLITGIIWREIEARQFSLLRFYERRIRRIAPALIAVLAVTTIAATAILLPVDLMGYGRSLLATLGFVSNIYFWRDIDYFSRVAEEKPLLHTWSLGIEEQFYIFFPLLLWACAWRPAAARWVVLAVTAGSLAGAIFAARIGADQPAFYLLPTRAWELGAGALLVLLPAVPIRSALVAQAIAILGAGLIGVSLLGIGLGLGIPHVLPAVLGTAAIIAIGTRHTTFVSRVLGTPPAVLLGKISYSLYLWHWPIIVFASYVLVRPMTDGERGLALAAMLALAVLSWRFVERPFRDRAMPARRVVAFGALGTAALAAAAAGLLVSAGLPSRLSPAAARINAAVATNYRCPISDYLVFGASRACVMALPSRVPQDADVVLLGNSHAQMYAPLVTQVIADRGMTGLLVPANGCLPIAEFNFSVECGAIAQTNIDAAIGLPRARIVVIGLAYSTYGRPLLDRSGQPVAVQGLDGIVAGLAATIDRLRAAGKQVILIGPIAQPGWDIASFLSRGLAFGRPTTHPIDAPYPAFLTEFAPVFDRLGNRDDVILIRPDTVQCAADRCRYLIDGNSLFADSNHLAAAALPYFRPAFDAAFDRLSSRSAGQR